MPGVGVVDLKTKVLENFTKMFEESNVPDVVLVIGDEKIAVHRFVLASHSKFFRVLLYGQLYMESNQPEVKVEAPLKAMKMLVEFSYSGTLDLRINGLPDVADLLELAHRYEFTELEKVVACYLRHAIDAENAVSVLEIASLVGEVKLQERCWTIVEMIVEEIYEVELDLSYERLVELLDRPRKVTEIKLFKTAHKLMEKLKLSEDQTEIVVGKIQFSRMMIDELIGLVKPTNVINGDQLTNIIDEFSLHKAVRLDERIVPVPKFAKVLKGINPENLFEMENQFTSHEIVQPSEENCILIDLGSWYIINSINLNCNVRCNYRIEVSTTMEKWTRVVDFTNICKRFRQNQEHYFSEVTARYIRFVGIEVADGDVFECNSVKIAYNKNPPKFLNGFTYPNENVAIFTKAIANFTNSKKEREYEEQLLNGSYQDQAVDTAFTSQVIENGSLYVSFYQPYILSSCCFCLWDIEGRNYSYKVETYSERVYEIISDKSDEMVGGWQRIDFSPRVVELFRFTGVKASVGNELRLVHFEAPAQE